METLEVDYKSKYPQISCQIKFEGSRMPGVFFFNVLCRKTVKTSNYSFRLQKGVENLWDQLFWIHEPKIRALSFYDFVSNLNQLLQLYFNGFNSFDAVFKRYRLVRYVFCSSKRKLSDGNNFSQKLLTFCCLHMRL